MKGSPGVSGPPPVGELIPRGAIESRYQARAQAYWPMMAGSLSMVHSVVSAAASGETPSGTSDMRTATVVSGPLAARSSSTANCPAIRTGASNTSVTNVTELGADELGPSAHCTSPGSTASASATIVPSADGYSARSCVAGGHWSPVTNEPSHCWVS